MKKNRLTIEDRILIEELLRQNYKLKDIARAIEVEPSTISREIKNRRWPILSYIRGRVEVMCDEVAGIGTRMDNGTGVCSWHWRK